MGTGGSVVVPFISDQNYKATGTFEVIRYMGIYIGSTDVRDTLAQLKIEADKAVRVLFTGGTLKQQDEDDMTACGVIWMKETLTKPNAQENKQ
jgi:hypothetical protein